MNENYEVRYAVGQRETNLMGTQALRDEFLIEKVFGSDSIKWVYSGICGCPIGQCRDATTGWITAERL
jgi:5-keto 4-deoxyuronate isomerase